MEYEIFHIFHLEEKVGQASSLSNNSLETFFDRLEACPIGKPVLVLCFQVARVNKKIEREDLMEVLPKQYSLLERYSDNWVLRSLVQLISYNGLAIGSSVDTAISLKIQQLREKRVECFFDELSKGNIQLTPQLIESEDFLHKYFITAKAALNSRRKEKIKMFARMLKKSTLQAAFSDTDEYEEYLQILDEMSLREFSVLQKLEEYSKKYPKQSNENKLQNANKFWDDFIKDMVGHGIPQAETESFLTRLNRTGCFRNLDEAYTGYQGGKGTLTETYFKLKNFVEDMEPVE